MIVDVHQHLWPLEFLEALRARSAPPRMAGWTLELFGGDRWAIDPAAHDVEARAAAARADAARLRGATAAHDRAARDGATAHARAGSDGAAASDGAARNGAAAAPDGRALVCVAPSAALGIDRLPPDEAAELAEAWLAGALALPEPFRAWATAGTADPDPDALRDALDRGAIGLELAADALAAPGALDRLAPLLNALGDRPLLVHPGPTDGDEAIRPPWWTPTVSYVNQLHAAWWAWADGGRARFPDLPVCFVALAGLGPVHGERQRARGGNASEVDPLAFVETSSYGTQAVDAVVRVLGIDVVCHGSDRPYAEPAPLDLDDAALHAIRSRNPARLLSHLMEEVPS